MSSSKAQSQQKVLKFPTLFFSISPSTDLRTAFDLLDRDQDGHVTPEELQFMLRNLGIHVRDELIDDLLREASRTGEFWGKKGRKRYLSCVEDRLEENFDYQESSFCRKQ